MRRTGLFLVSALLLLCIFFSAEARASWSSQTLPIDSSQFSVDHELRLLPNGTAVMFASTAGSDAPLRLLRRPLGGTAAVAPPFPASIATEASSDDLALSQPDASGNLLLFRTKSGGYGSTLLSPTASPATLSLASHDQITALSMSQSGAAAAIMSSGSTAHVSFRPAGVASVFDAPRTLDKMGNQRSYPTGITVDPDGGVFVVYETQQGEGLFQTYAPPGGDFGLASLLPVPEESIESGGMERHYAQSTNGHVIFTWNEYQQSGFNWTVRAYAMIRKPGGLLGPKKLISSTVEGSGKTVSVTSQGIADDGTSYAAILESDMNTRCPVTNIDGDSGMALAILAPSGASWTRIQGQKTWPRRTDFGPIVTAGNMVAIGRLDTTDPGPRCESGGGTISSIAVHRGKGASIGSAEVLASQDAANQNVVRIRGLAVNAVGQTSALTSVPSTGSFAWQLRSRDARYDADTKDPDSPAPILTRPGKIKLSGKVLQATRYRVALPTTCVMAGPQDKVYCTVNANITSAHEAVSRVKGAISTASTSAKAKGKKKGKKRQVSLGKAKTRIAPGKKKNVVIKLNGLAKKALKRGRTIPVTLKVTITKKGAKKLTITRKMKLRAKPAKKKKKGRGKAKSSTTAFVSATKSKPKIGLVKAKPRRVIPIDVNRFAYTDRIELSCRGKSTPLMAGWASPEGSAGSVSVGTYSDKTALNLMMVAPARAGTFKSWVTCLNRNLKTKYRYGKEAGEKVSRVSCAKKQVALGMPVRNAPYYDKNVYSRPVGANGWETNEGKYATAQVLCVAKSAMKAVKLVKQVATFKPGARTAKVAATCKGGRSPISWGFESDFMPDNTWRGGTNPVAAPLISAANSQGKRGWSLTFFTPDGKPAVKSGRVALHLTCAKPR